VKHSFINLASTEVWLGALLSRFPWRGAI